MQQIFLYGLATSIYDMGSNERLGTPFPNYMDTREFETVVVDDEGEHAPSSGADVVSVVAAPTDIGGVAPANDIAPFVVDAYGNRKRSIL
jgi:hypothetical protein